MKSHQFEPKVRVAIDPSILLRGGVKCVDKDGNHVYFPVILIKTKSLLLHECGLKVGEGSFFATK